MKRWVVIAVFVVMLRLTVGTGLGQPSGSNSAELIRLTRSDGKSVICELLAESDTHLTVRKLTGRQSHRVSKNRLAAIQRAVTEREAITEIGLAKYSAWRVATTVSSDGTRAARILVLPLLESDGSVSTAGQQLEKEMAANLRAHGMTVIERTAWEELLDDRELGALFDGIVVRQIAQRLSAAFVVRAFREQNRSWEETRIQLEEMTEGETIFSIAHTTHQTSTLAAISGRTVERYEIPERASMITFSPDGGLVATAGEDGTVKLWDSSVGQLRAILRGHENRVQHVAFSPDGRLVGASDWEGAVIVWEAKSRREVMKKAAHESTVRAIAFSPDGNTLATAGDDYTVRMWDVATQKQRAVLTGHQGFVRSLEFSADGRLLVSASHDRTIRLWDVDTANATATLRGHDGYVYRATFSPGDQLLLSASSDGTTRLWDVSREVVVGRLSPDTGAVLCADFSPDGRWIATCHTNDTVSVWDTATQTFRTTVDDVNASILWIEFSPGGGLLAAACSDGTVRVWNVPQLLADSP